MSPEILGTPLPDTVIGWIGLLVSIWAALLTVLATVEKFVEHHGGEPRRPYGGLALPTGWMLWCFALLTAHRNPLTVLIVLLGSAVLLIATQLLTQDMQS